ncbi:MarR family winged helix-turn-helix transcriptional regulator [Agromyces aurantiacus]|uniref:MarR family winged helix-turn-helix transcriptional regulator n=1 Tax=Agromyces aurantiacus TaxID=165814 RepID=A0ABV9R4C2_9MICO|nr:MarR family transcriptional regulator [Agromyces aurantiacus]MBM7503646.1 DNA-binding MarR family transcriptional regulator [Agromyces aurantiacus]
MTTDAERTWAAVLRLHAALLPRLDRAVARDGGMPLAWYDVLLELREGGGRLTMGQLAERVVLSRTRVSRLVDELVAAGLVERERHPDDGRSAYAVLTREGTRRFLAAARVYLPAIERELAGVDPARLAALADGLEAVLDDVTGRASEVGSRPVRT